MPEIDDDVLRTLLKEEYFKLQDLYESYDNRALLIKGWVTSGAVAGLALAFNASQFASDIPVFIAIVAFCIWMLETTWKVFQGGFAGRIRTIEAYFRDDPNRIDKRPKPLQIYHSWFTARQYDPPVYTTETGGRSYVRRFLHEAFVPFVCIPYLPLLLICGYVWWLLSGP